MNVQLKSYRKIFRIELWSKQWELKICFRVWNFRSKNPLNMSQQGKNCNGTGIQNCYTCYFQPRDEISHDKTLNLGHFDNKFESWSLAMIRKRADLRETFQVFCENGITVLVYLNCFYSLLLVKLLQSCKWYFKMDPLSFQSALCLATTGHRIIKINIFQIFDTGDQFWARVGLES